MTRFEAILKKAGLKTVADSETGALQPFISIFFEVPFNSELWNLLGSAAGDAVQVSIDKAQLELLDRKTGQLTPVK